MKNPYDVLEINRNSSLEEVKAAYRKLAKEKHPDRNPGDQQAAEKFKEIQAAYEVITKGPTQQPIDFSSVFNDFFSSMFRTRRRGTDVHKKIEITLEEVNAGIKRKQVVVDTKTWCNNCDGSGFMEWDSCKRCGGDGKVFVKHNIFTVCADCHGSGRQGKTKCENCTEGFVATGTKDLYIDIDPGVEDGMQVHAAGWGNPIKDGVPGDLIITIAVKPHDFFQRKGDDLYLKIPVSYAELMLGTEIEIPLLNKKKTKVKIEPGTVFESKIQLKKHGLPKMNGKGHGSLVVGFNFVKPQKMDQEYTDIMQKLLEKDKEFIDRDYLK